MKNNINLIIQDQTPKERVDQFLAKKYSELSRTRIKNLIIAKNLKINGSISSTAMITNNFIEKNGEDLFIPLDQSPFRD